MYTELHARSAFSFLEGSTLPEDLISACAEREMPAMALLDRDGLYGSPRFYLAAEKAGRKAHIGAEVSCEAFSPRRHGDTEKGGKKSVLTEELHTLLKNCHPERSEALAERSEGPAFPPHSALLSTNLKSKIKNQKSQPSSVSEPALS